jgi:hypothetical protein
MFRSHSKSSNNVNSQLQETLYDTAIRAINTDNLNLFIATINNSSFNLALQKEGQTIASFVAKKQRWNMLAFLANTYSDPEGKYGFHDALTMVAEKSPAEWTESHTSINQWSLALTLAQNGPDHEEQHPLIAVLHEAVRYHQSPDQPIINVLVEHLIYRGTPVTAYALATALSTANLATVNLLLQASEVDFALKKRPVILADGTSYESIEAFLIQQNKQDNFIHAVNYNQRLLSAFTTSTSNSNWYDGTTTITYLHIFNRLLCRKNLARALTTKEIEQCSTKDNKKILADIFKRICSNLPSYDARKVYIEKMENSALAKLFNKPRNPGLDNAFLRNTTKTWSDVQTFCGQQLGVFYSKPIDMEIKTDDDVVVCDLSKEPEADKITTPVEIDLSNCPATSTMASNSKIESPEEIERNYQFRESNNITITPKGSVHTSRGSFIKELYQTLENTAESNDNSYYKNLFERNQLELQNYINEKINNYQSSLKSCNEALTYLQKLNGKLLGKYFRDLIQKNIARLSEHLFSTALSLQAKDTNGSTSKVQYLATAINSGVNITEKIVSVNDNSQNVLNHLLGLIITIYNDHTKEKHARNKQAANANFNITSSLIAFSDDRQASYDTRLHVIHTNWQILILFIEKWPTNNTADIMALKSFQTAISRFPLDEYTKFYKNFDANISLIANSIKTLLKNKLANSLPEDISSKAVAHGQFRSSFKQLKTNNQTEKDNTYSP